MGLTRLQETFAASADRGEDIINQILEYAELLVEKFKKAKVTV
jgi:hypothetical protein